MTSLLPKEFLPLPAGPTNNFSQAAKYGIYRVWGEWCDVKFRRVLFTIEDYTIVKDDFTYADVVSGPDKERVLYGDARACSYSDNHMGAARIDLTGTGFRLKQGIRWRNTGYGGKNMIGPTFSSNRQIMNVRCRAQCGGCYSDALRLVPI
ncbi:uncharacterized protein LOC141902563 [Tubulanus polymorphus]|uniref:uncharacterized protein LOC141902563 n=1 Tax=Tubulanus polymorphus TaxID=672921 RepID=UPI003DA203CB